MRVCFALQCVVPKLQFAVLVKETAFKHRAVFYNFIEGKMTVIGDISVVPNTEIAWSPKGEFCVLVPLRHPEGKYTTPPPFSRGTHCVPAYLV